MPELWIGNGGYVNAGSARLDVTHHTSKVSTRLTDTTDSGTLGWARWKGSVREAEGSVKAFFDSTKRVDIALGLEAGAEVVLTLYYGSSGAGRTIPATISDVEYDVDNQTGYVTVSFNFKSNGPVVDF